MAGNYFLQFGDHGRGNFRLRGFDAGPEERMRRHLASAIFLKNGFLLLASDPAVGDFDGR
jgi:hypothetical protein